MEHVSIPLTDQLRAHMRARVASDGFHDEVDYLRSLIALDLDRDDRLRAEIQEGLDSGVSDRSITDILLDVKRRSGEAGSW